MGTFLIVLVIVGTLIVLGTRFSFYLYKSGALENIHVRRSRRLHPAPAGALSKETSVVDAIDLVQMHESKLRHSRIGLFFAVVVLVIAIFAIAIISVISAIFS